MAITKKSTTTSELRKTVKAILIEHGQVNLKSILSELEIIVPPGVDNRLEKVSMDKIQMFYFMDVNYKRLSEQTQTGYKSEFKLFTENIQIQLGYEPTLNELLEPINIKKYLDSYKNPYTYNRKCGFLRSFLRRCSKYFYNTDIEDLIEVLKFKDDNDLDDIPVAFKKNQLLELVELSANQTAGFRNFTILMTFLSSGIRLSEITSLRIRDIHEENGKFKVIAKGHGTNRVTRYINPLGYTILKDYFEFTYKIQRRKLLDDEYKDLYVFSAKKGKLPLSKRTIQSFVEQLIHEADTISDKKMYSVHSFRHSFAVYALESGINIYTISKLLGHKDIKTTAIYLKLFEDQLEKAIELHPFAKGIDSKRSD